MHCVSNQEKLRLRGDSRPRLSGGAKLRDSDREWEFQGYFESAVESKTGELRSPGQPRAAVPTCAIYDPT